MNRRAADRRKSDQQWPVQSEMNAPLVSSRMEQTRQVAGDRIEAGDVGAFVAVTEGTNVTPTKLTALDPLAIFR